VKSIKIFNKLLILTAIVAVGASSALAQTATFTAAVAGGSSLPAEFMVGVPVAFDLTITLSGNNGESDPTDYTFNQYDDQESEEQPVPSTLTIGAEGLPVGVEITKILYTGEKKLTITISGTPTTVEASLETFGLEITMPAALVAGEPTVASEAVVVTSLSAMPDEVKADAKLATLTAESTWANGSAITVGAAHTSKVTITLTGDNYSSVAYAFAGWSDTPADVAAVNPSWVVISGLPTGLVAGTPEYKSGTTIEIPITGKALTQGAVSRPTIAVTIPKTAIAPEPWSVPTTVTNTTFTNWPLSIGADIDPATLTATANPPGTYNVGKKVTTEITVTLGVGTGGSVDYTFSAWNANAPANSILLTGTGVTLAVNNLPANVTAGTPVIASATTLKITLTGAPAAVTTAALSQVTITGTIPKTAISPEPTTLNPIVYTGIGTWPTQVTDIGVTPSVGGLSLKFVGNDAAPRHGALISSLTGAGAVNTGFGSNDPVRYSVVSLNWRNANGGNIPAGTTTFTDGTTYAVVCTLSTSVTAGFTAASVGSASDWIGGADQSATILNNGQRLVITTRYTAIKAPVKALQLEWVEDQYRPKNGSLSSSFGSPWRLFAPPATEEFTLAPTVTWNAFDNTGTLITNPFTGTFEGGQEYQLTVTLTPKTGYDIENFTKPNGTDAGEYTDFLAEVTGIKNSTSVTLKHVYFVPWTVITSADTSLFWAIPAIDQRDVGTTQLGSTGTTPSYTVPTGVGAVEWRDSKAVPSIVPEGVAFIGGTGYNARIVLTAKAGYTFADASTIDVASFGMPGATVVGFPGTTLQLNVPVTALTVVKGTTVDGTTQPRVSGVIAPVTGIPADTGVSITATTEFTGKVVRWDSVTTQKSGELFKSGTVYKATIELTPAAGSTFIGVADNNVVVVGAASQSYSAVQNNQTKPTVVATYARTNFTGAEIAEALTKQITWDGAGSTVAIRGLNTSISAVTVNLGLEAATIGQLAANAKVGDSTLNAAEIASANISWDSDRRSVVSVDGIVSRPSADQADSSATLTAIVKSDIGDGTWEKPFALTVSKFPNKASEDLLRVKAALSWSAIREANSALQGTPIAVTRNLSLPVNGEFALATGGDSVQITWAKTKVTTDAPDGALLIGEDTSGTTPRISGDITRATGRSYDFNLTATIKNLRTGTSVPDETVVFNLRIMQKGTIPASVIVFEDASEVYTGHQLAIGTASINPLVAGNYAADGGDTTYTYEGVPASFYPASVTPPVAAGTYSVVVRIENDEFFGTKTAQWRILPKDIKGVTVTLEGSGSPSYTYDGAAKRPGVSSVIDSLQLTSADYTVDYRNNTGAGTGVVLIKGRGNYTGEDSSKTFEIAKRVVTRSTVAPPAARQYNGTDTLAGVVTVTFTGTVLNQTIPNSQYKIVAKYNSVNAGADSLVGTIVLDDTGSISRNYTLASDVLAIQLPVGNRITKRTLAAGDFVWFYNDSLNANVPTGHRAGRTTVGAGEPRLKTPLTSETGTLTTLYTVAGRDTVVVPNAAGAYPVKVKLKETVAVAASNFNVIADTTATVTISNYVISNPVPPVVLTQPKDTTVRVGGTVAVRVSAVSPDSLIGGVVAYQWYKNGKLIEGATAAAYSEAANAVIGAKDTFYVFVKNVVDGIQFTDSSKSTNAIISTLKAATSITFADVVVDTQYTYSGKAHIPPALKVKVTLDGVTLTNGTDYTFSTRDSLDAGTARVLVQGLNDYKDVAEGTYKINKKTLERVDLALFPPQATYNTQPQAVGIRVTDRDGAARTGLGTETISYRNTDTTKNPDSLKTTAAPVEAGEYAITVTVANDGLNFTGTPVDSVFSLGVYTVRRKTVENSDIMLNGVQFTGTLPNHLYTGDTLGVGVVTLKGTNDGTANVVYVRNGASVAPVEPGLYTVRVNISGYNNYTTVTYNLGTYTIAGPADLVAAAKARIEAAAFGPVADSAANTAAKAKAYVEGVIETLELGEEVTAVVSGTFTAATDSSAGSYVFTVALSVGSATATTVAKTVAIGQKVSVASNDRVIPGSGSEVVVVAPVQVVAGEFTVGPNPVAKASGKVGFFWQGKVVKSGTLYVFDASGNLVAKVAVSDKGTGTDRREIGSWNLTAKGAPVSEGTYLVKGALVGKDGNKVKVSSILGVAR